MDYEKVKMNPKDDVNLKEWEVARNFLKDFDDRIHDLRKWGFSFLTALLAAESLLIPGSVAVAAGKAYIPDWTKLAVMLVNLLLIVALRLTEKTYQLFIKSAVQRALILERSLNLELSETISNRYRIDKIPKYENSIYIFFAAGVAVLGYAILYPNYLMIVILILFTLVALCAIWSIKEFKLEYKHGFEDWTIDRLECKKGDTVRITLTNLRKLKPLPLEPGVVWEIKIQDGRLIHQERAEVAISIVSEDSYTWLWDTSKVESGIYRVWPRNWDRPLRRKIIVT